MGRLTDQYDSLTGSGRSVVPFGRAMAEDLDECHDFLKRWRKEDSSVPVFAPQVGFAQQIAGANGQGDVLRVNRLMAEAIDDIREFLDTRDEWRAFVRERQVPPKARRRG